MNAMLTIALRDLRGGFRSFIVFVAALLLGVAAVAAVGTVSTSIDHSVAKDSRALNGGDIELRQRNAAIDPAILDQILPDRIAFAEVIRTNTYAKAENGRRLVVGLKAVGDAYPLYGELTIEPPMPVEKALTDFGALAEPGLLTRLGIDVGDQVELGDLKVTVRGKLLREPDRLGGFVSIGPRLMVSMATLDQATIMREGALARFTYGFALPEDRSAPAEATLIREQFPDARFRTRSYDEVQPRVQRLTGRLETYLTLAAVAALLTGGFAVGLSIQAYLSGKERTIAAMRSQGATRRQVMQIYALQVAAIVLVGTFLGLIAGFLIPWSGKAALDQLVPAVLEIAPSVAALAPAALLGAITAAIFAILPLARASDVPAAHLFRAYLGSEKHRLRAIWYVILAGFVVLLALVIGLAVPQGLIAVVVLVAILLIGVLLALMGQGILKLLKRARRLLPMDLRTAAGSLTGPGNNSLAVIIGLGFGLAALITIAVLEVNLVREIFSSLPDRAPAMVLIDIQKNQSEELKTMLEAEDSVGILQLEPIVRARVVRIKGIPVEDLDLPQDVRWTINSDRGLSYTADPDPDINLVAGEWWDSDYGKSNPNKILLSIEDDVALGYGVWIGDTIGFNLAGRVIEAEIANVREEIDWGEGRLNFIFITSPGIIEQAPQTLAASLDLPSEMEPVLLDKLAETFPNVTPISIREIVAQLNGIVEKLGYAVRGVAAVTLFAGVLVVAAALQVSYRNRLRDLGIMRSIGATRSQARAMVMAEHGLMVGLACLPALLIGWTGAWITVRWVLNIEWVFAPLGVLLVLGVAVAISLISGFIMVTRLLSQNTASILRQA